jgi:integrase
MDEVGIQDRRRRNITFHSTRRFFNTLLRRSGAESSIVQKFTGHNSDDMTESYTDYLPGDMQVIAEAQKLLVDGKLKE